MKLLRTSILLFSMFASSLTIIAQETDKWKSYVDSSNELWFQAPDPILIRRDSETKSQRLYAFSKRVSISVRKQNLGQDPLKYVRGLILPFGERGTTTQDFKLGTFLVREEIEPIGSSDIHVTLYAGSKKTYFEVELRAAKDDPWFSRFVQTIRFGGSRMDSSSKLQDIKVDGEPIVFDDLPTSTEVETALNRKIVDSNSEIKFEIIRQFMPLNLDRLSREVIILERPRPTYTDSARMRNIQGIIPVNIEFLANGDIGKMVVDNRLDTSLAKKVIAVVKKIKFIPAEANGKPVDVVRTLLYKFSIY